MHPKSNLFCQKKPFWLIISSAPKFRYVLPGYLRANKTKTSSGFWNKGVLISLSEDMRSSAKQSNISQTSDLILLGRKTPDKTQGSNDVEFEITKNLNLVHQASLALLEIFLNAEAPKLHVTLQNFKKCWPKKQCWSNCVSVFWHKTPPCFPPRSSKQLCQHLS